MCGGVREPELGSRIGRTEDSEAFKKSSTFNVQRPHMFVYVDTKFSTRDAARHVRRGNEANHKRKSVMLSKVLGNFLQVFILARWFW